MKLAIAQIVLGALIAADSLYFGITTYKYVFQAIFEGRLLVFPLVFVLGLSVLWCGIAQFLKARE